VNKRVYRDFLQMLSFEADEVEQLLPDWIDATAKVGLEEQDLTFAMNEWLPKYWMIHLEGVRKCIGAYIRELIEVAKVPEYKAEGVKIVYGILPSAPVCYRAIKHSGKENVFVGYPDFLITAVLSAFFHKASLFAQNDALMSRSCRHCVLNRSRLNARLDGVIAEPDLIWSWGFLCNEAPKTEELIYCLTDRKWNYVVSVLPHDAKSGAREDEDESRVDYLAKQLQIGHEQVYRHTGIAVDKKDMVAAIVETAKYTKKLETFTQMVALSDPQPVGGNELTLFSAPTGMAFNTGFTYLEAALDVMLRETRDLIAKGEGVLPKGAPKLGCHFIPFCVPWVSKAFTDNGINLSFSTFFAAPSAQKSPNTLDPYIIVAQQWLRNSQGVNMAYEAELVSGILKKYHPDGMLYGFFTFDRWLGTHQKMMVKMVEEKTGIQHFYIEGEFWDDENYTPADRMGRIENIAYLLKMNKMLATKSKNSGLGTVGHGKK
jgi:benzoyl-CoA reductase/2-hydroxyglutaryl-CoA dehydratase subunit BcrC/BadD/HgdB